ncbi:MAG: lytic murein transglycosylase [Hyphomicrobiales bacterium]|nr:lytic murein transglycosylase [Hyphomicrobiales bacterium]
MICHVLYAEASARKPAAQERAFRQFILSLWPSAERHGVTRATFDRVFAGVTFDPQIVVQTRQQAEFVRPIGDYVDSAASPDRIERGRSKAQDFSPWLSKARETYGVDDGVILGIWGLESDFGAAPGRDNVIRALTSLAFVCFRGDYFRDELLSALVILQHGDVKPGAMRGSWAGAMGETQFMPSSYLLYAVDFEGHGKRDIWGSAPDAIGSTANFLAAHGWKRDLPWGFEVRLPPAFALTDQDSSRSAGFSSFISKGVRRADGDEMPKSGEGRLLIPAGLNGPIFLITSNFDVLKTYNASTAYALSVGLLGDAIKGGHGLVASWPAHDPVLNAGQVRELETKLKKLGYDAGEIDGMVGDSLRAAVRAYQERNGMQPDGYANVALLKRIEAEKPEVGSTPRGDPEPQSERRECK